MKHILGYRCTICGKEFPYTELMTLSLIHI